MISYIYAEELFFRWWLIEADGLGWRWTHGDSKQSNCTYEALGTCPSYLIICRREKDVAAPKRVPTTTKKNTLNITKRNLVSKVCCFCGEGRLQRGGLVVSSL